MTQSKPGDKVQAIADSADGRYYKFGDTAVVVSYDDPANLIVDHEDGRRLVVMVHNWQPADDTPPTPKPRQWDWNKVGFDKSKNKVRRGRAR